MTDQWDHPLAVRLPTLERQLRIFLRRGYRPARLQELLPGRERLLHVTFDDAYRSALRALPVLDRLGVPSTVFVCTDHATEGRPMDIPDLTPDAGAPAQELSTMTWDVLREIAEAGVEIGSHTVSHPRLTQLSDPALDIELRDSRAKVEAELGRPCRLLAYPYGDQDERVEAVARSVGYQAGLSMPGRTSPLNVYAVPRVGIVRRDGALRATLKASPVLSSAVRRYRPPT